MPEHERVLVSLAEAARRLKMPRSTVFDYAVGLDRFRIMRKNGSSSTPYIDWSDLQKRVDEIEAWRTRRS